MEGFHRAHELDMEGWAEFQPKGEGSSLLREHGGDWDLEVQGMLREPSIWLIKD